MRFLSLALTLLFLLAGACRAGDIRAFDADLTNYSYPFPVSFYDFEAQGQKLRMAYMDVVGPHPNGRTVVLLQGKNFAANYWKRTIADLVARGYRVIAPDQVGLGKSTKPAHIQYSFASMSDWTDSLLRAAGVTRYDLVGHSMGGMLAVRMALMHPQRIEKLVLVNPIGLEDWRAIIPYVSIDEWYRRELKATPESLRKYQRDVYFTGRWKPAYESLIDIPAGWTRGPDYPRIAWNSALLYDMIVNQPVIYEFGSISMSTLLIIGTRDRTAIGRDMVKDEMKKKELGRYDRLGREAAKRIPDSRLVEIENAGHLPQVEAYDLYLNALTGFLD